MSSVWPVAAALFDWRFCLIVGALVLAALLLPERYLRGPRSVRFNVWLFVIIAVASAIGTFLPQGKPSAQAVSKVGPFWAHVFDVLGILDIYHTRWFSVLLGLMAFDVVACKLRRLPRLELGPLNGRNFKEIDSARFMKRATQRAVIKSSTSAGETSVAIQAWCLNRRWHVATKAVRVEGRDAVALFAGRHRVQRWGDFVLHISIVLILAGNLLGAMFGFEEVLTIAQGGAADMKNRPYRVSLKDFQIQYYPSTGAPSLYASDVEVAENGRLVAQKRIIVNDPLDIRRVRFYQASWGMTEDFRSARIAFAGHELRVEQGKAYPIPRTPYSLRANVLYPSFDVDASGRAYTRNHQGQNPAIQIDFLHGDALQGRVWLLKNEPWVAFGVKDGRVFRTKPPPFRIVDIDPVLFSGIQIGYDPGAPVFWFGATMLLIGLCVHFYLHQRRLRVLVIQAPGGSDAFLGGWSSRGQREFELAFLSWTDQLRTAVGGAA